MVYPFIIFLYIYSHTDSYCFIKGMLVYMTLWFPILHYNVHWPHLHIHKHRSIAQFLSSVCYSIIIYIPSLAKSFKHLLNYLWFKCHFYHVLNYLNLFLDFTLFSCLEYHSSLIIKYLKYILISDRVSFLFLFFIKHYLIFLHVIILHWF